MSLGGRPKEEGGHRAIRISINEFIAKGLEKVEKGEKSKFIENVLKDTIEGMDPPDAAVRAEPKSDDYLKVVQVKVAQELSEAIVTRNFREMRNTFRGIRRELPVRKTIRYVIRNKPLRRTLTRPV